MSDDLIAVQRPFAVRIVIEDARYVFSRIASIAYKTADDIGIILNIQGFKAIRPVIEDIADIGLKFGVPFQGFKIRRRPIDVVFKRKEGRTSVFLLRLFAKKLQT